MIKQQRWKLKLTKLRDEIDAKEKDKKRLFELDAKIDKIKIKDGLEPDVEKMLADLAIKPKDLEDM